MVNKIDVNRFFRVGNNLSLDFVNTEVADGGKSIDLIEKTADLAVWTAAMNLVSEEEAVKILENWGEKSECPVLLAKAREFRASLLELFRKIIGGTTAEKLKIGFLNDYLHDKNNGFAEVIRTENGFEKKFRIDYREPIQILAVIAESAADLLCYENLDNLRKCENEDCVLLFLDTSKNHKRRWCSMAHCGNRAKAAAFYERKRAFIK